MLSVKQELIEIPQQMPAPRQELASAAGSSALNLDEVYITPNTPPEVMEQAAKQLADKEGSWRAQGLCNLADPELFNPGKTTNNAAAPAKKICAWCTVREECLRDAFLWNDQFAVRGGTSASERRKILKKRNVTPSKETEKSEASEEAEA